MPCSAATRWYRSRSRDTAPRLSHRPVTSSWTSGTCRRSSGPGRPTGQSRRFSRNRRRPEAAAIARVPIVTRANRQTGTRVRRQARRPQPPPAAPRCAPGGRSTPNGKSRNRTCLRRAVERKLTYDEIAGEQDSSGITFTIAPATGHRQPSARRQGRHFGLRRAHRARAPRVVRAWATAGGALPRQALVPARTRTRRARAHRHSPFMPIPTAAPGGPTRSAQPRAYLYGNRLLRFPRRGRLVRLGLLLRRLIRLERRQLRRRLWNPRPRRARGDRKHVAIDAASRSAEASTASATARADAVVSSGSLGPLSARLRDRRLRVSGHRFLLSSSLTARARTGSDGNRGA